MNSKIYGTSHFISFMQCIYLYLVYFYFNRKVLFPYVCKQRRKCTFVCFNISSEETLQTAEVFGAGGIKFSLYCLLLL